MKLRVTIVQYNKRIYILLLVFVVATEEQKTEYVRTKTTNPDEKWSLKDKDKSK